MRNLYMRWTKQLKLFGDMGGDRRGWGGGGGTYREVMRGTEYWVKGYWDCRWQEKREAEEEAYRCGARNDIGEREYILWWMVWCGVMEGIWEKLVKDFLSHIVQNKILCPYFTPKDRSCRNCKILNAQWPDTIPVKNVFLNDKNFLMHFHIVLYVIPLHNFSPFLLKKYFIIVFSHTWWFLVTLPSESFLDSLPNSICCSRFILFIPVNFHVFFLIYFSRLYFLLVLIFFAP